MILRVEEIASSAIVFVSGTNCNPTRHPRNPKETQPKTFAHPR